MMKLKNNCRKINLLLNKNEKKLLFIKIKFKILSIISKI